MIEKLLAKAFTFNKLHNAYLINVDNSDLAVTEILSFLKNFLYKKNSILNHPDFMLVERSEDSIKNISIQQIRKLRDFFNKTPIICSYKVALIKEVEHMTLNAANSCLKTLEEVNGNSYIFLITTNVASVLPTIRSRCRKIRYNYGGIDNTHITKAVNDYYIKPFLESTTIDEHLIYLKEFSCKGKKLWIEFTTNTENLVVRLYKRLFNVKVVLSDLEEKLLDQIKFLSINRLIVQYDYLIKLTNDTIDFDLDLKASYILLINLFKS